MRILVVAILLVAACSNGPRDVSGFLIAVPGEQTILCLGAVAESFPPQCVGERLVVEGVDATTVPGVQTNQGVTTGAVTLRGTVRDGVLTVA